MLYLSSFYLLLIARCANNSNRELKKTTFNIDSPAQHHLEGHILYFSFPVYWPSFRQINKTNDSYCCKRFIHRMALFRAVQNAKQRPESRSSSGPFASGPLQDHSVVQLPPFRETGQGWDEPFWVSDWVCICNRSYKIRIVCEFDGGELTHVCVGTARNVTQISDNRLLIAGLWTWQWQWHVTCAQQGTIGGTCPVFTNSAVI